MRQTYSRPYQQRRAAASHSWKRKLKLWSAIAAGVFVVFNAVLWLAYHDRTYPRTRIVDTNIGSVSYKDLASKTDALNLLPDKLTMRYQDKKVTVSPSDLGVSKDTARASDSANEQKYWLPIVNLFKSPQLKAPITINTATLNKKSTELAKIFQANPTDAHLQIKGTSVSVSSEKAGFTLKQSDMKNAIYAAMDKGNASFTAPVDTKPAQVKASSLKNDQQSLQSSINTGITYKFGSNTKQASASDVAAWYIASGNTYQISPDLVRAYIVSVGTNFGIYVKDADQVVAEVSKALADHKATTVSLTEQVPSKTFTYCTAVRGVSADNLPLLRTMLASTYADSRGWSMGGILGFKYASSGCNYTVWLSSAAQMPSFGGVCDSEWSCRSGDNVVINYDRWANASPAWNKMGGTIEQYRNMVINHESGHWLGFDHDHCGGAGQLAPVMQQQSINLQGCKFNPWPLPKELTELKTRLGL